jgi:hypothetical protein
MLRKIETIHLVTDCNFFPGFDIVLGLKTLDGSSDEIRFSLGIHNEGDAPGIIQAGRMWIRYSGLGNKIQEINSVQFSFSRPAVIAQFLSDLSGHLASLSQVIDSPPND